MPKNIFRIFLILPFLIVACTARNSANLGEAKTSLKYYIATGNYAADVTNTMAEAKDYIVERSREVVKPAIILDIDETSLSNLPQLQANDFSFFMQGPCKNLPEGPCGLKSWQQMAKADAVPGTLDLFNTAIANNIAVIFITGRDETVRAATEHNLEHAGYKSWTKLVMRPAGTKTDSAAGYKSPEREKIARAGYTIIADIGDQPSDLSGGYNGKTFLVPNPFYRIP